MADYWTFDGKPTKGFLTAITHAVGFDEKKIGNTPLTYDEIWPGAWKKTERLADMTSNHVEASLCFCNAVSSYAGQLFFLHPDKELALACIQAYNDWMIGDWCAGEGYGRLIPLIFLPLWDPALSAQEVRRCAAKSMIAASFLENPHEYGLPTVYSRDWDPLFQACHETRTNLSMHIGSSPRIPTTSKDAPYMMTSIIMFIDSMTSALDFLLAGVFERFPNLKIAYSEGQIGWLPYAVRRADKVWLAKDKEGNGYQRTQEPAEHLCRGPRLWLHLRRRHRADLPRSHRHGADHDGSGLSAFGLLVPQRGRGRDRPRRYRRAQRQGAAHVLPRQRDRGLRAGAAGDRAVVELTMPLLFRGVGSGSGSPHRSKSCAARRRRCACPDPARTPPAEE